MTHISKITINEWMHLGFAEPIELKSGVNLVIGRNGSGKTSILDMIGAVVERRNQALPTWTNPDTPDTQDKVRIEIGGEVVQNRRNGNTNEGNWTLTNNDILTAETVRYIRSERKVSSGAKGQNALHQQLNVDITDIRAGGQDVDVAEEFHKAIMKELYNKALSLTQDEGFLEDIKKSYQDGLVDFEKTLQIDMTRPNAIFFTDIKGREVEINKLSSGEKEYLYFYSYLRRIQDEEGKVVLIDEPELHLHSSQIKKLCELIGLLAQKNQIIIATHSGEVMQYFIAKANIVLLSKGEIKNIGTPEDLQVLLAETGLPVDPSIFTARWICAENEPNAKLKGVGAPTTPELLSWIFGNDIQKRYWSFGSNSKMAFSGTEEIIASLTNGGAVVDATFILDADKRVADLDAYPLDQTSTLNERGVAFLPCWEIENIIFVPEIIDQVFVGGNDRLWSLIEENKVSLRNSIFKTIVKNGIRRDCNHDAMIRAGGDVVASIDLWKEAVNAVNVEAGQVETKFETVITNRDWKSLPGKEVLGLLSGEDAELWDKIKGLKEAGNFYVLLSADARLNGLFNIVNRVPAEVVEEA